MNIQIQSSGSCPPQTNDWATFGTYAAIGLAVSFMVLEPEFKRQHDEKMEPHTVEMTERVQPVRTLVSSSGTYDSIGTGSLALSSSLD